MSGTTATITVPVEASIHEDRGLSRPPSDNPAAATAHHAPVRHEEFAKRPWFREIRR